MFHSLNHTINVVRGVKDICHHLQLSGEQLEVLLVAAWFHDTGYIKQYKGHEAESQKLARSFLDSESYPIAKTEQVLSCIAATEMPQKPENLLEKVICDADLFHLSLWEYPFLQQQLREEQRRALDQEYTNEEWMQANLSFLKSHRYFTTYGREVLQKRKLLNIQKLKELQAYR
ncbi:MAG: HD domain-containing protein [Phaeodactylibacter sp.]|nr:HD domain-containing protein [Phaeodactylibacter sp.]